jgi:hypothetical protein
MLTSHRSRKAALTRLFLMPSSNDSANFPTHAGAEHSCNQLWSWQWRFCLLVLWGWVWEAAAARGRSNADRCRLT